MTDTIKDFQEQTKKTTTDYLLKVTIIRILAEIPARERIIMLRGLADMYESEIEVFGESK